MHATSVYIQYCLADNTHDVKRVGSDPAAATESLQNELNGTT